MTALLPGGDLTMPAGYTHNLVGIPLYLWEDYRAALNHIRTATRAETRIANLLHGVAITGPTGRLSAFPAESVTWLDVAPPDVEAQFIQALEGAADSVVVWAPTDEHLGQRPRLVSLVRRLYEPEARFGDVEIWRRR